MILDRLRAGCDEAQATGWTAAADVTVMRAHQHAAGARRKPPADVCLGNLSVGDLGSGTRNSLAQYLAGELSRRIKSGELTPIEAPS